MKFSLLLISLIIAIACTEEVKPNIEETFPLVLASDYDHAFEEQSNIETLKKAGQCIVEGKNSVEGLIQMGINLVSQNYIGAIINIVKVTKNIFNMLDDCGTLFCFGPTVERCENDHGEGNCEQTGLVIYPKCKEGFTNWACCVCANECPEGFRDDGLYCAKPKAYGRGAGYVLWQRNKCESQNPQGCEKNGLLWYPKCRPGFHNVGCCICSPDCPSGWTDIGVSCKKPESYGRGVGYPVSFGLKCIREYNEKQAQANKLQASEDQEQQCAQAREVIKQLNDIVEDKFQKAKENPDVYQPGLPDQIKRLAELIDRYAESCVQDVPEVQE